MALLRSTCLKQTACAVAHYTATNRCLAKKTSVIASTTWYTKNHALLCTCCICAQIVQTKLEHQRRKAELKGNEKQGQQKVEGMP